jgi:hypothetical protein
MTEYGFSRQSAATIGVELPGSLLRFLDKCAKSLVQLAETPNDPAYSRLCGPINVAVDYDDPLATLERQMTIESVSNAVVASIDSKVLSDEQAEMWLQVLSMSLAVAASRLGIVDDDYADHLDPNQKEVLELIQAMQWSLVEALEAETPSV